MKKSLIISILYCTLLFTITSPLFADTNINNQQGNNATSTGTDLSKMSGQQLLEFYKKNKDYGKKRLTIDYQKYIEGDWVVLRGEYIDQATGSGIPNEPVVFQVNGEEKIFTTTDNGIFELEMKKSKIEDKSNYRIIMNIGHYRNTADILGVQFKKDSIYHFKVYKIQKNPDEYTLSIEQIHNRFFKDGNAGFEYIEKVILEPSLFGIQGKTLYTLVALIAFLLITLYTRHRFKESEKSRTL